jgi:hypothetical protein
MANYTVQYFKLVTRKQQFFKTLSNVIIDKHFIVKSIEQ